MNNFKKSFLVLLLFTLSFSTILARAEDISLNKVYLESITSPIVPGSEFSVDVFLNTKDPINAFDIEVVYNKDNLEFLNFDNTDSIVDIWQASPLVSIDGNLVLSGGIIKAFSGEKGLLIKLSFQAIKSGNPSISFVKNDLYIADGKGTKIIASTENLPLLVATVNENKNAKIVQTPSVPFQPTKEDVIIKKELKKYETKMFLNKMSTPIFILLTVFFVICILAVYNKSKRKKQ